MAAARQLMLAFHKVERNFFHRLVRDLGQQPESMRWVMALWLWLESAGHHNFIHRVSALPGHVVLRREHPDGTDRALPCTNALLAEPVDGVGYLDARRDEVLRGVKPVYRDVCLVIFDDDIVNDGPSSLPSRVRGGGGSRSCPPPVVVPARGSPGHAYPASSTRWRRRGSRNRCSSRTPCRTTTVPCSSPSPEDTLSRRRTSPSSSTRCMGPAWRRCSPRRRRQGICRCTGG